MLPVEPSADGGLTCLWENRGRTRHQKGNTKLAHRRFFGRAADLVYPQFEQVLHEKRFGARGVLRRPRVPNSSRRINFRRYRWRNQHIEFGVKNLGDAL